MSQLLKRNGGVPGWMLRVCARTPYVLACVQARVNAG